MNSFNQSSERSNSALSLRRGWSPTRASGVNQISQSQQQQQSQKVNHDHMQSQQAMFLSETFVGTALVRGSFKTIVQLPKYVDIAEWIALNVFELYTNLIQFYGVVSEYVTPEAYPTMNVGSKVDYLWSDANNMQLALPASQYIDLAFAWIENKINDKSMFPTQSGMPFPQNFLRDVQGIMTQMFRIFAHIYHYHFDKIAHLSLEAHWNSFFAHFISFAKEFNLLDRPEMYPLEALVENLELQGKII